MTESGGFSFPKDVWSLIIQFIPSLQLAKFRALNKTFYDSVTQELRKRCSTLDDPISIAQIVHFAYKECTMSHVTYQGRDYYPCDTYWCKRPPHLPPRDYDPNIVCYEDFKCTDFFLRHLTRSQQEMWAAFASHRDYRACRVKCHDLAETVTGVDRELIKGYFKVPPVPTTFDLGEIKFPILIPDPDEPLVYHFDKSDPKTWSWEKAEMIFCDRKLVYLPHPMRLINCMGMNEDHRGRNHANIQLDYFDEFEIPAGIHSVYNIVQSCYRIKGNKFENNYELFCIFNMGVDPNNLEEEDMEDAHDAVTFDSSVSEWIVRPLIDHGS